MIRSQLAHLNGGPHSQNEFKQCVVTAAPPKLDCYKCVLVRGTAQLLNEVAEIAEYFHVHGSEAPHSPGHYHVTISYSCGRWCTFHFALLILLSSSPAQSRSLMQYLSCIKYKKKMYTFWELLQLHFFQQSLLPA